jgi:hypothetical protein
MPRFYFDLISTSGATLIADQEGGEFPDLEAALKDAEQGFAELLTEAVLEHRPVDFAAIDVRDEARHLITTLRFDGKGKRVSG